MYDKILLYPCIYSFVVVDTKIFPIIVISALIVHIALGHQSHGDSAIFLNFLSTHYAGNIQWERYYIYGSFHTKKLQQFWYSRCSFPMITKG